MGWAEMQVTLMVFSAVCAVVAAAVSVVVLWRARRDLSVRIHRGDRASREHTDRAIAEVGRQMRGVEQRMGELEDGMARIETKQERHLEAKDLSPLHDKINNVASQVAAGNAATQAMREQLRVIQEHLMRGNRR